MEQTSRYSNAHMNIKQAWKPLLFSGCIVFFAAGAAYGEKEWSKDGDQTIVTTFNTGGGALAKYYVAAGTEIKFNIGEFEELDSWTDTSTCPDSSGTEDDDRSVDTKGKVCQFQKTGGTIAGNWDGSFATDHNQAMGSYTVPETANAGDTVEISLKVWDNRPATDPRHDPTTTYETYTFEVTDARPTAVTLVAASATDVYGSTLSAFNGPGKTKGNTRFTMEVSGANPPNGNWNGYVITEDTTAPVAGNANDFVANPFPNTTTQGVFTVRAINGTNNRFYDYHGAFASSVILAAGKASGTSTQTQKYYAEDGGNSIGTFTITKTYTRVDDTLAASATGDRVKVTASK